MYLKFLALVAVAIATQAARADIIYGPITFGDNTPLVSEEHVSQFAGLPTYTPAISLKGSDLGSFSLPAITIADISNTNIGYYQAANYSHNAKVETKSLDSDADIFLGFSAVPEPSTPLLVGTGLLALVTSLSRRRSRPRF